MPVTQEVRQMFFKIPIVYAIQVASFTFWECSGSWVTPKTNSEARDFPIGNDGNLMRVANRRQSMRDDDRGTPVLL